MRSDEVRGFRRDVAVTFPLLADRYAGDLTAIPVEQPWFLRHQVLRLDCLMATGLRVFAARGSGKLVLLSGRLDRLEELVERERPRGVDVASVVDYAGACDEWTSPYDVRPTTISSVDDLTWGAARPGDVERMTRLAEDLAGKLHPPRVTRSAGNTYVVRCVLTGGRLLRRRLTVEPSGALRRDDQLLAERLPVLPLRG
jgi:hypothetical protein